jgi:hypothetical protein
MYEHRRQKLISGREFVRRMTRHGGWALMLILGSLLLGVAGFHWIGGRPWIDALLNASMLLGGMGPVGDLGETPGKLFASAYALYAGLIFLIVAGLLFAPVFHRILHKFHLETGSDKPKK